MSDLAPVIDLLSKNLGLLNTSDGEQFHYVPMLADIKVYGLDGDDADFNLNQKLAEGIALLLDQHGMLAKPDAAAPDKIVSLTCALCSGAVMTVNLSHPLSGKQIIEHVSSLDPHCGSKHAKLTPDVIRLRIQEQMAAEDV
jgi:hypothetical protein